MTSEIFSTTRSPCRKKSELYILILQCRSNCTLKTRRTFRCHLKGNPCGGKASLWTSGPCEKVFRKHEIPDIGIVRSKNNIADGLKKAMNQGALLGVIKPGLVASNVVECIVRNGAVS